MTRTPKTYGMTDEEAHDAQQDVIKELNQRILQLLIERDRWQAIAEEKIALRREIETALGIETGDTNDEALAKGVKALRNMVRLDDPVVTGLVEACEDCAVSVSASNKEKFFAINSAVIAISAYEARVKEVGK